MATIRRRRVTQPFMGRGMHMVRRRRRQRGGRLHTVRRPRRQRGGRLHYIRRRLQKR